MSSNLRLSNDELARADHWVASLRDAGSALPVVYEYLEALVAEVRDLRVAGVADTADASTETLSAAKRKILEHMLSENSQVMIVVDARADGVDVPSDFEDQYNLCLRLGHNLKPSIDLVIDDDGISCVLSFRKVPYQCLIPWEAVWCAGDVAFPDSVPKEARAAAPTPVPVEAKSRHLSLVPVPPTTDDPPPEDRAAASPPHYLSLVPMPPTADDPPPPDRAA